MPTYDYRCKACGHRLEVIQKITEDAITKCPQCSKRKLERLISPAGLVFRGSGFYINDYGTKANSPSE